MIDIVTPEVRSRMMRGIRSRDTLPEILIRRRLWALGFRYRKNRKVLPGLSPDLVLRRYHAVVLVHGCFWHRHRNCPDCASVDEKGHGRWAEKFEANVTRDKRNLVRLHEAGWRTAVVWECAVATKFVDQTVRALAAWLKSTGTKSNSTEIGRRGNAVVTS